MPHCRLPGSTFPYYVFIHLGKGDIWEMNFTNTVEIWEEIASFNPTPI
jgi:hypothetical protein